jgi:chromosome segregation ATPase
METDQLVKLISTFKDEIKEEFQHQLAVHKDEIKEEFQHRLAAHKDEIKEEFRHQLGIQTEHFQHKLDFVVEGHQMLSEKIDRGEERLDKRMDCLEHKLGRVAAELGEVKSRGELTAAKLDRVAVELSAHRRDTETHPPVYKFKEPPVHPRCLALESCGA